MDQLGILHQYSIFSTSPGDRSQRLIRHHGGDATAGGMGWKNTDVTYKHCHELGETCHFVTLLNRIVQSQYLFQTFRSSHGQLTKGFGVEFRPAWSGCKRCVPARRQRQPQGGDLLGWSIGLDCSHHKHFDWVLWLSFEVTWAFSLPIVQKVISPYCPYWKIWLGQLKHIWLRRLDFRLAPRPAATRTRICLGVVPRTEVPAVRHWRKFSSDYGLIHVNSFGSKMDGFISFIPILWLHGYIPSWDDVACRSSWWRAPWPDSKS